MKNKTIEELERLAGLGEEEAMYYAGQYYEQQGSFRALLEAAKWFEKLADTGNFSGIVRSLLCNGKIISVFMSTTDLDNIARIFSIIKRRGDELLEICKQYEVQQDLDAEKDLALRMLAHYKYGMGLYYIDARDWQNALKLLKDADTMDTRIARGVCRFQMEDLNALEDLSLIRDSGFINKKKILLEEEVYYLAALQLAAYYRIGLSGFSVNYDKAVEILSEAVSHIDTPEFKEYLVNELNKYQKKLFSGYKYVG